MKSIQYLIAVAFAACFVETAVATTTNSLTGILKQHVNETVREIEQTENGDEKRLILNDSFSKMLSVLARVEEDAGLSGEQMEQLQYLKKSITDKQHELNGYEGFDRISDEDLDDFTDYVQQDMEQADRTITISLTTALLIIIILLLL